LISALAWSSFWTLPPTALHGQINFDQTSLLKMFQSYNRDLPLCHVLPANINWATYLRIAGPTAALAAGASDSDIL